MFDKQHCFNSRTRTYIISRIIALDEGSVENILRNEFTTFAQSIKKKDDLKDTKKIINEIANNIHIEVQLGIN